MYGSRSAFLGSPTYVVALIEGPGFIGPSALNLSRPAARDERITPPQVRRADLREVDFGVRERDGGAARRCPATPRPRLPPAQCEHMANVCVSMCFVEPSVCPPACWTTVQYDGSFVLLLTSAPTESLGYEPRTW